MTEHHRPTPDPDPAAPPVMRVGAATYGEAINLGIEHERGGRFGLAEACYREALRLNPQSLAAHCNLGGVLGKLGRLDEAEAHCSRAVQLNPAIAGAHLNLGFVLAAAGRPADAVLAYQQALRLEPNLALAELNLAGVLGRLGRLDEAEDCCRRALRLRPGSAEGLLNLGYTLLEQGRLAEAEASYRGAVRVRPDWADARSALLLALNYDPARAPASLLEEHRLHAGAGRLGPRVVAGPAPTTDRDPGRRLRVGYVSADLRQHPVGFFLLPIIAHHDPGQVEAFCYAEGGGGDATTARIRAQAAGWRPTSGLTDEQVAEMVRRDRIDILVDLAGHTAGNRLGVLARRPAPIQVTYLGYPNTTGLEAIDYLLTDSVVDPPGEPSWSTESPYRLPVPFCCYAPPANAPEVGPLPAGRDGAVTFGALHKLPKLNPQVLDLWADLLQALPSSRLLLYRDTLQGKRRGEILAHFTARGIAPQRVDLRGAGQGGGSHWEVYQEIDVALDVFPWCGHTTACEALWMGVPVVTLRGDRHAGRMTASVLTALGLTEAIAATPAEYLASARRLADDRAGLARLRTALRGRMQRSPLCDGRAWTRGLEAAYRAMWQVRCVTH